MRSPAEVGYGIMYTSLYGLRDDERYLGQESIIIKKVSDHLASTLNGAASLVWASLVLQS